VRRSFIRIRPSMSASQSSGYLPSNVATSNSQATPRGRLLPPQPAIAASPQELKDSTTLIRVPLPDGRVLEFDPFTLSAADVDVELREEGVSERVRGEVKEKMRSRVMELQARLMSR
jgi:hypothetical protein